jgi:hypothetical protein
VWSRSVSQKLVYTQILSGRVWPFWLHLWVPFPNPSAFLLCLKVETPQKEVMPLYLGLYLGWLPVMGALRKIGPSSLG